MTVRQATLAHEAGHVVGGLLAGHRIETVRLGPTEREPKNSGTTMFEWAASPEVDLYGHLVAVLMGPMAAGGQPPAWPPLPDLGGNDDEHVVLTLVSHLKLTRAGYMAAVALAAQWLGDPLVKSAVVKVAHALGQTGFLTDAQVRDVGAGLGRVARVGGPAASERGAGRVKCKYIEAVDLTALGEGEMVALASTLGDVDKHGDRVVRGACSTAVAKLKAGASLPLVWGHDVNGSPQNFVGEIHDADETDEGLEVRARFDLDDPVARKAYRLVKQGAIDKLSIGYRVRRERRATDGVKELLDIELHEVSLVLSPANERARVLAIKDAPAAAVPSDATLRQQARALGIEPPLTRRQLRRRSDELALEHALGWQPPPKVTPEPAKPVPTAAQQRQRWDRLRLELLTDDLDPEAIEAARDDPDVPTDAQLREQAKALGLPVPPPRRHPDYTALRAQARREMLTLFEQAHGR